MPNEDANLSMSVAAGGDAQLLGLCETCHGNKKLVRAWLVVEKVLFQIQSLLKNVLFTL